MGEIINSEQSFAAILKMVLLHVLSMVVILVVILANL